MRITKVAHVVLGLLIAYSGSTLANQNVTLTKNTARYAPVEWKIDSTSKIDMVRIFNGSENSETVFIRADSDGEPVKVVGCNGDKFSRFLQMVGMYS